MSDILSDFLSEYIKKIWVKGEIITAEGLNNLETGVSDALKKAGLAISAAEEAANGGTKMESGWYNGTGVSGTEGATLTFSFVPKFIIIIGLVEFTYSSVSYDEIWFGFLFPEKGMRVQFYCDESQNKTYFSMYNKGINVDGTSVLITNNGGGINNPQQARYCFNANCWGTGEVDRGYHYVAFG